MRVKMKIGKGEKREVERGEGGLKRGLEVMLLYRDAMWQQIFKGPTKKEEIDCAGQNHLSW